MGPIPVAARLRPLLRRGSLDRGMSHEGAAGSQLFVSRGGRPREEAKPRRLDLGLSVSRAVDGRRLLRKPPGEQRFARSWQPEGTGTEGTRRQTTVDMHACSCGSYSEGLTRADP